MTSLTTPEALPSDYVNRYVPPDIADLDTFERWFSLNFKPDTRHSIIDAERRSIKKVVWALTTSTEMFFDRLNTDTLQLMEASKVLSDTSEIEISKFPTYLEFSIRVIFEYDSQGRPLWGNPNDTLDMNAYRIALGRLRLRARGYMPQRLHRLRLLENTHIIADKYVPPRILRLFREGTAGYFRLNNEHSRLYPPTLPWVKTLYLDHSLHPAATPSTYKFSEFDASENATYVLADQARTLLVLPGRVHAEPDGDTLALTGETQVGNILANYSGRFVVLADFSGFLLDAGVSLDASLWACEDEAPEHSTILHACMDTFRALEAFWQDDEHFVLIRSVASASARRFYRSGNTFVTIG